MDTKQQVIRAQGFGLSDVVPVWKEASELFVALLRRLDPLDRDAAVPSMKWTVAETAAHMLTIVRRGLGDFRRADTLEGLAELNDQGLEEIPERDLPVLADLIEADMGTGLSLLAARNDADAAAPVFPLHVGVLADIPTAISYSMFDFLVHGYDIAKATGAHWSIQPDHAGVTLQAILPALRPWVIEEVLSGPTETVVITFSPDVTLALHTGQGVWGVEPVKPNGAEMRLETVELLLGIAGREEPTETTAQRLAAWFAPI
ncbi:MAG: maleylpyruvate isomerase family mycothiol-dependent enzyme [Actinomycetota bacterium]